MSSKTLRTLFVLLCTLTLITGIIPASADTADMEKVNVSWDLTPDRPVTVYTRFYSIERPVPVEAVITDFEHVKAKKGNNQVRFRLTFINNFEPTDEEISIAGLYCSGCYLAYCVNDYKTGLCIEGKNKVKVSVKVDEEVKEKTSLRSTDGTTLNFIKKLVYYFTIEYPETYDGLCIGALGRTEGASFDPENDYWNGKLPFSKTVLYSPSDPSISHFMRIDPSAATEPKD